MCGARQFWRKSKQAGYDGKVVNGQDLDVFPIIVNKVTKIRRYHNKIFCTKLSQNMSQDIVIAKRGCYTK